MIPDRLKKGDVIGLISPSHVASEERYKFIITKIESFGYRVKVSANMYSDTYGYLASEEERASDFNAMACDPEVRMVFFGGGDGALEILPLIDYGAVARDPKIYMSYSDGTSILGAIYSKTGLTTYYGQSPSCFEDLRYYDYAEFMLHIADTGQESRPGEVRHIRPKAPLPGHDKGQRNRGL